MQRRTLWIILGSVAAVLVALCVVAGAAGLFAYRVVQQQQQQQQAANDRIGELMATVEAAVEQMPSETPALAGTSIPTPTEVAADEPSDTPAAPSAAAQPTQAPAGGDAGDSTANLQPLPTGDVGVSLVAGSQAALEQHPDASSYRISARLDPASNTITGEQTVRLRNTEDTPLDAIYFRLYVNAAHYGEGGVEVSDVRVAGAAVEPELEVDDTALRLPLAQPLAPGADTEIAMRFVTTVPSSGGGYAIFNEDQGIFTLYNWHPELAVYEDGAWLLDPVSDQGDPTNTDAANYEVSFAAPEGLTIITSGIETDEAASDGQVTVTSVMALARNFVVVAGDKFERVSATVGETEVNSYYWADSEAGGQTALDTTAKSLELFGAQFGPYPYTELDVAQVSLGGGAAGMESTGLIMIGSDYYDPEGANPLAGLGGTLGGGEEGANVLVFTTAHEAAHQWWYSVVGSDAYREPWLDESLTNWSSAFYVDQIVGEEAGKLARDVFIGLPYRDTLIGGDVRLDQPVDEFSSDEYGSIVYGKGALMYDVLREELGEAKFTEFLQRYYREQSFDRADGEEWLQTLSAVAGRDMTPFYDKWVEGRGISTADLPPGGPLSGLLEGDFGNLLPQPEEPSP